MFKLNLLFCLMLVLLWAIAGCGGGASLSCTDPDIKRQLL
jgi:hypothetical protein